MSNTIVLYHKNCQDGRGAAWAAHQLFGQHAEYIPVQYGEPIPEYKGYNIFIVDFSYPKDDLIALGKDNFVQVIDHHKTAQEDLKDFPERSYAGLCWEDGHNGVHVWFDMAQSGAMMTYKYFFPESEVPLFLEMVQDRDLWQFKFPRTKHLHAYLSGKKDLTFDEISELQHPAELDKALDLGAAICSYIDGQIEVSCAHAMLKHDDEGRCFATVNSPIHQSDIGARLLELHPDAQYADIYFIDRLSTIHSLRSRAGGPVDVSEIAQHYNGGGHSNAAGYKETL